MQPLQPSFAPLQPLCTSLACDVSNTWSSTARSKFTAASFLEKVYTLQCGCIVPGGKATQGLERLSHALHITDGLHRQTEKPASNILRIYLVTFWQGPRLLSDL
jgi:hypothetical protein